MDEEYWFGLKNWEEIDLSLNKSMRGLEVFCHKIHVVRAASCGITEIKLMTLST